MSKSNIRRMPRIEEPNLDDYVLCDLCGDYVFEYCSIHGPQLVIPDNKVPTTTNYPLYVPHAALTVPRVFLHLAPSIIPGAGIGVFSTLTLPRGIRFGPYSGQLTRNVRSTFCWQVYGRDNLRSHVVDAGDPSRSNWMRYVNCARHWHEQNLVAYQYRGEIYYCTIKTIPRFTELLVFYGSEFADSLHIDLRSYNSDISDLSTCGFSVPNNARNQVIMSDDHEKHDFEIIMCKMCAPNQTDVNYETGTESDETLEKKAVTNENNIINRLSNKTTETKLVTGIKAERPFGVFCKSQEKNQSISYKQSFESNDNPGICGTDYSSLISCVNKTDRPFRCNTCHKCFKTNSDLKRHMSSHASDRPFSCDVCKKSFKASSHVKKHMLSHSLDRPYCCDICCKCLKSISSLKRHMLSHAPYIPVFCNVCKKQFKSAEHVQMHMFSHEPGRQYSCNTCQKSFTRKYSLKRHIRNHL